MENRYWFVVFIYSTEKGSGTLNMGCVTDDKKHLNNQFLREQVSKGNKEIIIESIVMTNFIEFKSELDYLKFWGK